MMSVSTCSAAMAASYYQKDNYYAKDITAEDKWQGKLCRAVGLKSGQTVNAEAFQSMLDNSGRKCAAYDVTFSAQKSVSIAAETSEAVRSDVMKAHHEAVEETLNEIEKNEIGCRITKDGVTTWTPTGKAAIAKFDHNISRDGDMQLHTHAIFLNKTELDGKDYSIDGRRLYATQKLYGTEYRSRLAAKLQNMGYEVKVTDAEKGFFELSDIKQDTIDHFSKRRTAIVAEMAKKGVDGAEAAQAANLKTRQSKKHLDMTDKRAEWRNELQSLNQKAPTKGAAIKVTTAMRYEAFTAAVKDLESKQFAFTTKEIEQAAISQGTCTGMTKKHADKFLNKAGLVKLNPKTSAGLESELYYTSKHNLSQERSIVRNVETGKGIMPAMAADQVASSLSNTCEANGWTLTGEQTNAVQHIAQSKDQFIAVRGLAGTGKTFTLNATREILEANGYTVKGMAPSGQAASELEAAAGIKSGTVHHALNTAEREAGRAIDGEDYESKTSWDFGDKKIPPQKVVYIMDEASLADNNSFHNVQKMAQAQGAKVVFVGDNRQMPPVGCGNAFNNLVQNSKISTCSLVDIQRQKNSPELLAAVKEAVGGQTKASLDILSKNIKEIPSHAARMKAVSEAYTSLPSTERAQTLVLTAKNADRMELNNRIRAQLIKKGELTKGKKFIVETKKDGPQERFFAPKDRIVFLKNDNRLGVKNGTNAVITDVDSNKIIAELADHKAITIDTKQYKNIDHAYCLTPHKGQGKTVDRAIINMDSRDTKLNSKNAFYVDISRAKSNVKLFCDNRVKLDPQISSFCHKITSQDFKRPMQAAHGLKGAKSVKGLTAKDVASMDFGKAWSIKGSKGKGFKMPKVTKAGIKSLAVGNLTAATDIAKFGLSQNIGLATKGLDALNKAWKIIKVPFSNNPNWSKVDMSTVKDVAKMTAAANKPKVVDAFTSTAEKDAIANSVQTLDRSPSMHR